MPFHSYTRSDRDILDGFFESHREAFLDAVITHAFDPTTYRLLQVVAFLLRQCHLSPSDQAQPLLQNGAIQYDGNITYFETWRSLLLRDLNQVRQDHAEYNANAAKMGKHPLNLQHFWQTRRAAQAAGPKRLFDGGILADGSAASAAAAEEELELSPHDAKIGTQPPRNLGAGDLHPRFTSQYPLCHQTIWSDNEGVKDDTTGGNKKLTLLYDQTTETVGGHSAPRYYLVAKSVHSKGQYQVLQTVRSPAGVFPGFQAHSILSFGGSGAEQPPQAPPPPPKPESKGKKRKQSSKPDPPPKPDSPSKPKPPRKRH